MRYTITGQVSVLPLNEKFQECDTVSAKYQLEIYDIQSKRNTKLGIIEVFNNKQFSHSVNSKVSCVPKTVVNRIMLSEYIGHNGHTPR